jgi:hypothetical protein
MEILMYSEYSTIKAAIRLLSGNEIPEESPVTKQEAIQRAIERAMISDAPKIPGAIICKMSEKEREALKECSSKDWNHRI